MYNFYLRKIEDDDILEFYKALNPEHTEYNLRYDSRNKTIILDKSIKISFDYLTYIKTETINYMFNIMYPEFEENISDATCCKTLMRIKFNNECNKEYIFKINTNTNIAILMESNNV